MARLWLVAAAAAASDPGLLRTCSFQPLDSDCIRSGLSADGALAVTGVPGLASARAAALMQVARCATADDEDARRVTLPDGTLRRTYAAETVRGVAGVLASSGCDDLGEAADPLRALVDHAMRRVLGGLEGLVREPVFPSAARAGGYASLGEVAQQGLQLEHFHAYAGHSAAAGAAEGGIVEAGEESPPSAAEAVPLHTDAGLAIAVVPPLYLATDGAGALAELAEAEAEGGGLVIERRDGQRARLPREATASSLILMLGDGWEQWLNPRLSEPLRAAPHAMTMPRAGGARAPLRLWYGRMYLPPADAMLPPHGFTFEAVRARWRDNAREGREDELPVACAGGARRALQDADGCFADQILCWHQCKSVADLPCGEDAVCRSDSGALWVAGNDHCVSCQPVCEAPAGGGAPSPPGEGAPFCSGPGTVMHMSGFMSAPTDCVNLLFVEWKLDTRARFGLGVLGTVLLAVTGEFLTWFRRNRMSGDEAAAAPTALGAAVRWLRARPLAWRCAMASLFALQATLGYFVMLLAMTYQTEIFLAVVFGLAVGHGVFNVSAPVSESADACCVDDAGPPPKRRADAQPVRAVVADAKLEPAGRPAAKPAPAAAAPSAKNGAAAGKAGEAGGAGAGTLEVLVHAPGAEAAAAAAAVAIPATGGSDGAAEPEAAAADGLELRGDALDAALLEAAGGVAAAAINSAAAALAAREAPDDGRPAGAQRRAEAYDKARRVALASFTAGDDDELAAPQELTLQVEPMTCSRCERTVLAALEPVEGVAGVHVDLASRMVTVRAEAGLKVSELTEALRRVNKETTLCR